MGAGVENLVILHQEDLVELPFIKMTGHCPVI
jgi:hypothetical protein